MLKKTALLVKDGFPNKTNDNSVKTGGRFSGESSREKGRARQRWRLVIDLTRYLDYLTNISPRLTNISPVVTNIASLSYQGCIYIKESESITTD